MLRMLSMEVTAKAQQSAEYRRVGRKPTVVPGSSRENKTAGISAARSIARLS